MLFPSRGISSCPAIKQSNENSSPSRGYPISQQSIMDLHYIRTSKEQQYLEYQKIQSKLKTSKIFVTMVIHDLRNPTLSLQDGIGLAQTRLLNINKYEAYTVEMVEQQNKLNMILKQIESQLPGITELDEKNEFVEIKQLMLDSISILNNQANIIKSE